MRYRINTPSIIYEVLDGEAVILNLEEGIYYSLNETGKEIWSRLSMHWTAEEIAEAFAEEQGKNSIRKDVASFIQQLMEEKMIVPSEISSPAPQETCGKKPFATPLLHTYHDMKELLLLDPIHEVDQAGWPIVP
jgi:hypothetical protein